jgi:hypothetical protein
VKQWGNVRSFVIKDGHLFLSLMADGGIYEIRAGDEEAVASVDRFRQRRQVVAYCWTRGEVHFHLTGSHQISLDPTMRVGGSTST